MKRKLVIISLVLLLSLSLISGSLWAAEPYAGTTIRVLAWADAHTAAVKKLIPEFEEETGIDVVFDDLPSSSLMEKAAMNLTSETGTYDLVAVDEPFMPRFAKFFIDYNNWPQDTTYYSQVKVNNLADAAVMGATWQNKVAGLPINGNVYMSVYRKDLLEDPAEKEAFKKEYGYELKAPQNLDQLLDICKFFYRPDENLYGWGPFTMTSEGLTVEAMWILRSFGTGILTEDLQPALDKEKAVAAFDFYKKLLETSPPGKLAYGHPERIQAMNMGQLVFMLQWPAIIPSHENEEESLVVGKMGYMKNPAGPARAAAVTGVWALGMPEASQNKKAAAEFAYWWASKDAGLKLVENGMSPVRKDLLSDSELQNTHPWYEAQLENFTIGVNRPRFPEYSQISEIVRSYFAEAINGEMTSTEAVEMMDQKIKEVLDEYGYLK